MGERKPCIYVSSPWEGGGAYAADEDIKGHYTVRTSAGIRETGAEMGTPRDPCRGQLGVHCWGQALVEVKGRGQCQDWDVKDLVAQGVLEHGEAFRARRGFSQEWHCRRPV